MAYKTAYQRMLEIKQEREMSGYQMEDPKTVAEKTIEALSGFKQHKHSDLMVEYNIIRKGHADE